MQGMLKCFVLISILIVLILQYFTEKDKMEALMEGLSKLKNMFKGNLTMEE